MDQGGVTVDSQPAISIADLVARRHADVYRYAYRLCGSAPDAEDLSQQVFLIAHQKLDQLNSADAARAWLLAITRNCYWRWLQRRKTISAADADLDMNEAVDGAPADDAYLPIDRELLQRALDRLPEEFRLVINMFYFEELSYRQIAAALDVPEGTVMSRLSRAKARLRRDLSPEQVSDSPGR
jgi:RNA polymerase sigma-70 factor (ECF subfamily)